MLKICKILLINIEKNPETYMRIDFEDSMSKKEKYNFRGVEFVLMGALNQRFWIQCTSMTR